MRARIGAMLASCAVAVSIALVGACTGLDGLSSGSDAGPDAADPDAATESDAGPDVADARPITDGCPALADTTCKRYAACAPAYLETAFGGPTNCLAKLTAECNSELSQADILSTLADVDACTAALAAQTCDELRNNVHPASCVLPGRRNDGEPCVYGEQCKIGFCGSSDDRGCGTCGAAPAAGAACSGGCGSGLTCSEKNKCVVPAAMGATCDDATPCNLTLQCKNGTCAPYVPPGGDCDAQDRCDLASGYACGGGSCVPIAFPQPGEPCGALPTPNQCAAGVCLIPDGGVVGTCIAVVEVNGRCGTTTAPCGTLMACIAGECAYPTDAICSP